MKSKSFAVAILTVLAFSCTTGVALAQPQAGIVECDGYLGLIAAQPDGFVAIPVYQEGPAQLTSLRVFLNEGTGIASSELVASSADGLPDRSLSQSIASAETASGAGWVTITPAEDVVAPPGKSWLVLRLQADSPESEEVTSTIGYQLGVPEDPALLGDGYDSWGALAEIQLAVQPSWEVSGELVALWGPGDGVTDELTAEVEPTVVGFRHVGPNPASSGTSFYFSTAVAGAVTVELYNVRGRKVRTVGPKVMPAGQHSVFWDGMGNNGTEVANGVYFARFTAPGISSLQRVMIVR